MDAGNFVEIVRHTKLPFVYGSERLNDEKCKKVLQNIGVDSDVLGVITASGLIEEEGLAILKTGIKYSLYSNSNDDSVKVPNRKGEYPFDRYILQNVSVSLYQSINEASRFDVSMAIWDISKKEPFNFQFRMLEDFVMLNDEMREELENTFKCLVSKTWLKRF